MLLRTERMEDPKQKDILTEGLSTTEFGAGGRHVTNGSIKRLPSTPPLVYLEIGDTTEARCLGCSCHGKVNMSRGDLSLAFRSFA